MSQKILMPALSPTMTEGTLAKWVVKVGDMVESGQVIAEIETDKATMEVEAVDEGVIAAILIEAGTEGVAVNTMIAMLAEEGEDVAEVAASANQGGAPAAIAPAAEPNTAPAAEPNTAPAAEPNTAPAQQAAPASSQPASAQKTGDRIFISPLAKRLAVENGLDLGLLKGTGPRGRIHKADIELAVKTGSAKPQAASANASAAGSMITIDGDAEF
ncbi:MAG: biotin/lipoyl-containing protein, partial [Alphaproteobacteria bacterium]